MLEHVLREAGTVAELAQKADEFGMDAVHARVERGLFAHFADLHFKLLLAFVDNILNAGRMDAPVLNEAFKGHLGDLAAQGAVCGQDDCFGSVVDDEINAGSRFQSADVAPFTADDAAFHVFAGQGHGGDGVFAHIVARIALDGTGDDLLGLAVRGFAGFGLNEAHHLGGLVAGAGLDFRKKPLPGLLGGQAGDFLQTVFLLIDAFVERFLKLGKFPLLFGEVFFDAQEFVFFFGRFFKLFLKPLALLLKLAVAGLQLALAFLELMLKFALLVEQLVLALKKDFLLLRLSFLAGFFDYAGRQLGGVANPLGIEVFIEIKAYAPADAYRREDAQGGKKFHKSPPFIVSGRSPFMQCHEAAGRQHRPRHGEDILMGKEEDNTIRTMEKTDLYKRCPRTGHQK